MITLHTPTVQYGTTEAKRHDLRCLKEISGFKETKKYLFYIQRMSKPDNRYMVYTSSGVETNYAVFNNLEHIEKHFEEIN